MTVFSLYVINKSGGLIYYTDFVEVAKQDSNTYLRLASTFHSMHAIAKQLSPVKGGGGISVIEADVFRLHCLQTATGIKFFLIVDKTQQNVDGVLGTLHELYSDFVMKNPFYELEMPIRIEQWDRSLQSFMTEVNK